MLYARSARRAALALLFGLGACASPAPDRADAAPLGDAPTPDQGLTVDAPLADAALPAPDSASPPDAFLWPDFGEDRPLKRIERLRDEALKTALHDLVKDHQPLGYTKAKAAIFVPAAGGIDVHNGIVECVYTGITVAADGSTAPGGFNVEHSWPQSEGADTGPAESDLHHLFPADASANSHRSSLPFGNTRCGNAMIECQWEAGESKIGPELTTGVRVFQVRPLRRGDIARAHFYFAVRYELPIPAAEEAALRGWNAADLPDAAEGARNDAIEGLQQNRNPFVDRPDLVERIGDF